MSFCVKITPGDYTNLCGAGPGSCTVSVPLILADPDCSQGLVLLTSQESSRLNGDIPVNTDRVADLSSLFYAFLLVLVSVWGIKRLADLFSGDTSRD